MGLDIKMVAPDDSLSLKPSAVGPELSWSLYPNKPDRTKIATVLFSSLFTAVAALLLFHNPLVSIVAGLLIVGSVADKLLQPTYLLYKDRIVVKYGPVELLEMAWADVSAVYNTVYGIKLSPFASPKSSTMERFRGILLRIPENIRPDVEAAISKLYEAK